MAQIINEDIVINYLNSDKDECLHFLTHIDAENGPAPDASYYISVTAKAIYTSPYNVWFLNTHYNCKNVVPCGLNTKVSLTFKGINYVFTFLDAKHCLGSVSLLLYGPRGAYLYTGNFAYCSNFLRYPLVSPLVERKVPLKCLYMDGKYYEQDTNFLGIDDNIELMTALMRHPSVRILLFIDSIHLYPTLVELAIRLQEKIYISTSESMKFLKICGYDNYFTTQENGSRITVFEKLKANNSKGLVVFFHRIIHKKINKFKKYKVDPRTSAHHFYFYGSSNLADCRKLLYKFLPEELMCLNQAVIDSSKMKYTLQIIVQSAVSSTSSCANNINIVYLSKNDLQLTSKLGARNAGDNLQDNDILNENVCELMSESTIKNPMNHLLDSISHESNDDSIIIISSDDESEKEVETNEKSLKGTSRLRKFVSSSNSSPIDVETQIRKNIMPCSVVINTNSIRRHYFYSPFSNCYLPSFFGFHKSNSRPRKELKALRMLKQKLDKLR